MRKDNQAKNEGRKWGWLTFREVKEELHGGPWSPNEKNGVKRWEIMTHEVRGGNWEYKLTNEQQPDVNVSKSTFLETQPQSCN